MEGWSRIFSVCVFIAIMGPILYQNTVYLFIRLYRIVIMVLTCENNLVFNEHRIQSLGHLFCCCGKEHYV